MVQVKTRTKAAIGKREGKIDNRTRLEVIQGEEKRIEEDKKDMEEEKKKKIEAKKKVEVRWDDYKEEVSETRKLCVWITPILTCGHIKPFMWEYVIFIVTIFDYGNKHIFHVASSSFQ